jgi:excisionase family DNA binding protein
MTNFNILFEELITVISERVSENIIKNINTPAPQEDIIFLNIDETAKLINLAKATVYGLVHHNKIPYHKKAKRLYFLKSEVLNWVIGGKQNSKSETEIKANEYLSKNRLY